MTTTVRARRLLALLSTCQPVLGENPLEQDHIDNAHQKGARTKHDQIAQSHSLAVDIDARAYDSEYAEAEHHEREQVEYVVDAHERRLSLEAVEAE